MLESHYIRTPICSINMARRNRRKSCTCTAPLNTLLVLSILLVGVVLAIVVSQNKVTFTASPHLLIDSPLPLLVPYDGSAIVSYVSSYHIMNQLTRLTLELASNTHDTCAVDNKNTLPFNIIVSPDHTCSTISGIPFNCDTQRRPNNDFCALMFGDPTARLTTQYEHLFSCRDSAHFHCVGATQIYDYCITWDDVDTVGYCTMTNCAQSASQPTDTYTGQGERPAVGYENQGVSIIPTISLKADSMGRNGKTPVYLVCITTNTNAAVAGILTAIIQTQPPITMSVHSHARRVCQVVTTRLHRVNVAFSNFYEGDTFTKTNLGDCA